MTITAECTCGHCRTCLRALFPPIPITDAIRAQARAVIERLDAEPELRPRPPRKIVSAAIQTKPRGSGSGAQEKPVETPCRECGGMRALLISGARGIAVSGKDGLCEACHDRPIGLEALRAHEAGEKRLNNSKLRRTRKLVQRVLKDGRAFHPEATHGLTSSYSTYVCRCSACREAKAAYLAEYRAKVGRS